MLSFQSHCSHKLRPLDRTVHGLRKKYINSVYNVWILNQLDYMTTIHNIVKVVAVAYPLAIISAIRL